MAVQTTLVNKPLNPRGNDQSPLAYNRAKLFSGKALDFDGVNDEVTTDLSFNGNTLSVSFYLNWDDYGTDTVGFICEGDSNGNLMVHLGGIGVNGIRFVANGSTFFDTIGAVQSGWNHYVITAFNNNHVALYVNGSLFNSQTLSTGTANTSQLNIGFRDSGTSYNLDGQIAGFKLFNTALTAAQVADLYNNPEKVVPTGVDNTALKLWLPMQEGAGTTALNGAPDALGSEEVTNGDFATDSDWNKAAGWTISGGKANANTTGNYINLYQSGVFTIGKTYKVSFDITDYTSGDVRITEAGYDISGLKNAVGSYSFVFTASYSSLYIQGVNSFVGSIDNVSVKEIQNVGTISGATWTHGVGAPVAQTSVIDWNKVTLDLTNEVLVPQGLTSGRDLLGNLFENVRKQGALNLDGNSWAEVHDNESLDFGTGEFTLEAWAKAKYVNQGSSLNAIMTLGGQVNGAGSIGIISSGGIKPITYYNAGGTSSTGVQNEGDWFHIVGVYDGTNRNIYINGAFDNSNASTAADITNALVKMIGRDTTSARYYKDQIAQPRIYNRALTAEEVQRNYNAGKNIYTNS